MSSPSLKRHNIVPFVLGFFLAVSGIFSNVVYGIASRSTGAFFYVGGFCCLLASIFFFVGFQLLAKPIPPLFREIAFILLGASFLPLTSLILMFTPHTGQAFYNSFLTLGFLVAGLIFRILAFAFLRKPTAHKVLELFSYFFSAAMGFCFLSPMILDLETFNSPLLLTSFVCSCLIPFIYVGLFLLGLQKAPVPVRTPLEEPKVPTPEENAMNAPLEPQISPEPSLSSLPSGNVPSPVNEPMKAPLVHKAIFTLTEID
jgi:hypothetical protein